MLFELCEDEEEKGKEPWEREREGGEGGELTSCRVVGIVFASNQPATHHVFFFRLIFIAGKHSFWCTEMDPPAKRARPYDGPPPFNRTPLVASPSSSSSLSLAPLPSPTFGSFPQEPPLPTSLSGPSRKIKRKPAATGKSRLQDLQKGARVMPTSEDLDDGIWVGQLERDKMGFARSV